MGIPLHPAQLVENLRSDLGGSFEQSYASTIADTGSFEIFTATFLAFASSGQGDYLAFSQPDGTTFAVWLDKDANNTAPSGAVYTAAAEKVEVEIVTGNTATQVAAAVKAAIELNGNFDEFTISALAGVLTFTSNKLGNPANAAPHNTGDTGDGSVVVSVTTSGAASNLNNKYIQFRNAANSAFYAWANVNSEGADPAPGGTGIEVALTTGMTAAQVATAYAAAIDAHANFEASADGSRVKISTVSKASTTDADAGDSGFSVSSSTQGSAAKDLASSNPADISNNPSAF